MTNWYEDKLHDAHTVLDLIHLHMFVCQISLFSHHMIKKLDIWKDQL